LLGLSDDNLASKPCTAYLDNSGTLENAQAMAAHEGPRAI
jgi:hypothetical protein